MASRPYGAVLRQIDRLFRQGSASGLSEWQLLERYATRRDEAAFEALLERHGPMVLGVCRRVLDDPHAVEDAFQATFLVLVRKAGSLGPRDAIGHWLYGVASRVALRARCEAARRGSREVTVERAEGVAGAEQREPGSNELAAILDEELGRLPPKYRAPVVLCYLEGLTHEQAAHQLQWPIGSVKGRLARARELLRGRLSRRGVLPTLGLLAATLHRDASAAVPETLRAATVQAAAGIASGSALHLMEGALSAMFMSKLKLTAAALGTCGVLAFGAWELTQASRGGDAQVETKPAEDVAGAQEREQTVRDTLAKPFALSLEKARLEDVLKAIRRATQAPNTNGVPIYVEPEGLKEAGATLDSPVTIDARKVPLESALESALRPLKLAASVRDGLLVVSSREDVTLIELRTLNEGLRGMSRSEAGPGPAGRSEELSPAAWLKRIDGPRTIYLPTGDTEVTPEDAARIRAVLAALQKRVDMQFANETPLEDVVAHIRKETKSQELPDGIPIYVDPVGLNEAEKTMTSPITIDLKGVALRDTLRLLLRQLGLTYTVKDGLLSITSESSEDTPTPIRELEGKALLGELTLREMNDLIELGKTQRAVENFSGFGEGPIEYSRPPRFRSNAEDDPRTGLILNALERVVPLHFERTPIEDALRTIRRAAATGAMPQGIPIYHNPSVAGMSVSLDLKDAKLKTSLRLMLGQCGLTYTVRDGLLIIAKPNSPELGGSPSSSRPTSDP